MMRTRFWQTMITAALAVATAAAAQPTTTYVRVAKLYSSMDAAIQAVELDVVRVGNTPLVLAERTMSTRDRFGNLKSFLLSGDADGPNPPDKLMILASIWVETNDDAWGPYADLLALNYFLPVEGGTVTIDGMDEVAFGALPLDGFSARDRNGENVLADFGVWGKFKPPFVLVREYYNAGLDHYFMTARADEMRSLSRGEVTGWLPTGNILYMLSDKLHERAVPICRYLLLDPTYYSHFFSASEAECNAVGASDGTVLESAAVFYAGRADGGRCDATVVILYPGGSSSVSPIGAPIYRLWNGKLAANHRYVIDSAQRDAMVARGWVSEGEGDGVAWCGHSVSDVAPSP